MTGSVVRRQSKVNELQGGPNILPGFKDPVLKLEVTVTDVSGVEEGDCREHLRYSFSCLLLLVEKETRSKLSETFIKKKRKEPIRRM